MDGTWYPRDASFFAKPNTSSLKRLHLPHPTSRSKYGHTMSLCGGSPIIDDKAGQLNPIEGLKCRRCLKIAKSQD